MASCSRVVDPRRGHEVARGRPTLKDVAARAGVSISTVSYALNDASTVTLAAETRSRIRTLAREMGYVPNSLAQALQARSSRTVAVVLDRPLTIPRYAGIVQGVVAGLTAWGYRLALLPAVDEVSCTEEIRGGRLDGLIYLGHDDEEVPTTLLSAVESDRIPFVALDCGPYETVEQPEHSTVDFSYETGVRQMVGEFRRREVRRLVYVRPDVSSRAERERERALMTVLGEQPGMQLSVAPVQVAELMPAVVGHGALAAEAQEAIDAAIDAAVDEAFDDLDALEGLADSGETVAVLSSWGAFVERICARVRTRRPDAVVGGLAAGTLDPELWAGVLNSVLPLHEAGEAAARLVLAAIAGEQSEHLLLRPRLAGAGSGGSLPSPHPGDRSADAGDGAEMP